MRIVSQVLTAVLFLGIAGALFLAAGEKETKELPEIRIDYSPASINSDDGKIEIIATYLRSGYSYRELPFTSNIVDLRIVNKGGPASIMLQTENYDSIPNYRCRVDLPARKTIFKRVVLPYSAYRYDVDYRLMVRFPDSSCSMLCNRDHRTVSDYELKSRKFKSFFLPESVLRDLDPVLLSGCFGLVYPAAEWDSLSSASRNKLMAWVEQGGTLIIPGKKGVDARNLYRQYPPQFHFDDSCGLPEYGRGRLHLLDSMTQDAYQDLFSSALNGDGEKTGLKTDSTLIRRLSLRPFLPVLVIFGLILGPGILFFCKKKNMPGLSLVLIPVSSIGVCIIILLYALVSDGLYPHVRLESVTYLNQLTGKSISQQRLQIETTMGMTEDWTYPDDTFLVFPESNQGYYEAKNGKFVLNSILSPRIPQVLHAVRFDSRSERLEFRRDDHGMTVINGLGVPLKSLLVCDADGARWTNSDRIEAGASAVLARTLERCPNGSFSASGPFTMPKESFTLARGCYSAIPEENRFLEFSLKKVNYAKPPEHRLIGRYLPETEVKQ